MCKCKLLSCVISVLLSSAFLFGCSSGETSAQAEESTTAPSDSEPEVSGRETDSSNAADVTSGTPETAADKKDEKMYDFELSKYVALGTYKGIKVRKTDMDQEVANIVAVDLKASAWDEEVTDRAAAEGDRVSIDYLATINGKTFAGGSAKNFHVTLGSNVLRIAGIEKAVVGMSKGESKGISLELADDFSPVDPEINGRIAQVTIKLNRISRTVTPEVMTDEIADKRSGGKYKTAAEYKAALRLEAKEEAVWTAVMNNITILDCPEKAAEKYYNTQIEEYENLAGAYGLELGAYVSMMYHTEEADFLKQIAEQSLMSAASDITVLLICEAEGITCTDEEFTAYAEEFAEEGGLKNAEAVIEEMGRENLELGLKMKKVLAVLTEAAVET